MTFRGPKSAEERQQEKHDEQTVIEATIRAQREVGAGCCDLGLWCLCWLSGLAHQQLSDARTVSSIWPQPEEGILRPKMPGLPASRVVLMPRTRCTAL